MGVMDAMRRIQSFGIDDASDCSRGPFRLNLAVLLGTLYCVYNVLVGPCRVPALAPRSQNIYEVLPLAG